MKRKVHGRKMLKTDGFFARFKDAHISGLSKEKVRLRKKHR